jgi:hypothetical protein
VLVEGASFGALPCEISALISTNIRVDIVSIQALFPLISPQENKPSKIDP